MTETVGERRQFSHECWSPVRELVPPHRRTMSRSSITGA